MRISHVTLSSRCKDGSLVKEYVLTTPLTSDDLTHFRDIGEVTEKNIGGTILFTCTAAIVTLKGMIDDTVIYITHKKEDTTSVDTLMYELFG